MSDESDQPRRFYKWSELKWAKQVGGDAQRHANAAWSAAKRMIARGERPMYRVDVSANEQGFQFTVVELPWHTGTVATASEILPGARARIADWLRAPAEAFDVELVRADRPGAR